MDSYSIVLTVEDFERYLNAKGVVPTNGERKWYTFVLTETTLDEIVYGVLARWINMYSSEDIPTIIEDLKYRTTRKVISMRG